MALPDLSRMSQADAIAALQQYFAQSGQLNPQDPYAGSGFAADPQFSQGVQSAYGNDKISGLQPTANGGFSGALTPSFDPIGAGGQYGQYRGEFDAQGNLNPASVQFGQDQRHNGWISENMPLVTAAAMGGSMLASGGFGAGAGAGAGSGGAGGFSGAASGAGAAGTGITEALGAGSGFSGATGAGLAGGVDLTGLGLGGTGTFGELTGATMLTGGGVAPALTTGAGGVTAGLGAAGAAAGGGGAGSVLGSIVDGLGGTKGLVGLAGAAAGALGAGPDVATTSRDVPEWAQKYGPDIVDRGRAIADTPFQPYTGQRFAGPNDAMRDSWEMASQFARGGPSSAEQTARSTYDRLQGAQVPDFGKATQIDNKYIGNPTAVASNQYIGQNVNSNVSGLLSGQANPYLGQTTGSINPLAQMSLAQTTTDVGRNALLGQNNPYLNDAIGYATGDITRNFNNTINPQLDRMARASGSFGNSGVEQARQEAQRTMAQQVGRTTSDMRMQDYNLQAQLGEGDLGRRLQAGLTDASRNLGASQAMQQFNIGNDFARQQANMGYRAGDLTRNMAGYDAAQGRALDAGKFDATNAQRNWETNLGATSDLSKFNAGQANDAWATNLAATSDIGKFNAGQGNFDIKNGIDTWNSAEDRAARSLGSFTGFDDAELRRAGILGATGKEMQTEANRPLDFAYQEFLRGQDDPYRRLSAYTGAYGAGVNGQSVQSTPTGNSPAANMLGGATMALGAYDLMTRPTASTTPTDTTQPRWFSDWLSTQRR